MPLKSSNDTRMVNQEWLFVQLTLPYTDIMNNYFIQQLHSKSRQPNTLYVVEIGFRFSIFFSIYYMETSLT